MFNLYFNKILRYCIYETRRGLGKKKERGEESRSFNDYVLLHCHVTGTELGSEEIVVKEEDILPALKVVFRWYALK